MVKSLRFWCTLALALLLPLKAAMAVGAACHLQGAGAHAAGQAGAHPCQEAAASAHHASATNSAEPEAQADAAMALVCAAACAAPLLPGAATGGSQGPLAGHDWREQPFARPGSFEPTGLEKPPRST